MGRKCRVCHSPDRRSIEELIIRKKDSLRSISQLYNIAQACLSRHRDDHMHDSPVKQLQRRFTDLKSGKSQTDKPDIEPVNCTNDPVFAGNIHPFPNSGKLDRDSILRALQWIGIQASELYTQARKEQKHGVSLSALKEIREVIKISAQMQGYFIDDPFQTDTFKSFAIRLLSECENSPEMKKILLESLSNEQ